MVVLKRILILLFLMQSTALANNINSQINKNQIVKNLYFYSQTDEYKNKFNIGRWLKNCVGQQISPFVYIQTPIINNIFSNRRYMNITIDVIAHKTKTPIELIFKGYYKKENNQFFMQNLVINGNSAKFEYDSYAFSNSYFMRLLEDICL